MQSEFLDLIKARKGHFRLESGHHGDLWLDLDGLFVHTQRVRPFVVALAEQLAQHNIEAVCGPLVGGAFVAQGIAAELTIEFYYTERFLSAPQNALYAVEYRLPPALESRVAGKSVAIVDDVINAGSAVRGTHQALVKAEAVPTVVGTLLTLGAAARDYFTAYHIPVVSIAWQASGLWAPDECPLCAQNVPLEVG